MQLIQILIPLYDNQGRAFARAELERRFRQEEMLIRALPAERL
jgi:hypothetical protein